MISIIIISIKSPFPLSVSPTQSNASIFMASMKRWQSKHDLKKNGKQLWGGDIIKIQELVSTCLVCLHACVTFFNTLQKISPTAEKASF